jgi:hypothetical protein
MKKLYTGCNKTFSRVMYLELEEFFFIEILGNPELYYNYS